MSHRIFHKGLQRQFWNSNGIQVFRYIDDEIQIILIPRFRQHQVIPNVLDLLSHRGRTGPGIRGIAEHASKLVADFNHIKIAAFHGFRADNIECIVDEMRANLVHHGLHLGVPQFLLFLPQITFAQDGFADEAEPAYKQVENHAYKESGRAAHGAVYQVDHKVYAQCQE